MINCQRCAVAHEARMCGYNVIARPSWGDDDPMRTIKGLLSVFENSRDEILKLNEKELAGDIVESVKNKIVSLGEGSRVFIWFNWNPASGKYGGHVIVGECRKNNVLNIGDPQLKIRSAAPALK